MTFFQELHTKTGEFIANWKEAPELSGRGIVTTLYESEFASGWVQLMELQRIGSTLPVEVFYRPGELSDWHIGVLEEIKRDYSLTLRVLDDDVSGFAIKPFAILNSSFREVLWLDTDNVPTRDPEFLFDDPDYVAKGSLFWRDVSGVDRSERWHPKSPTWLVFGVPYNDGEEFETGQLLIDKSRCWDELGLVTHYATDPVYYAVVHGDKDTFRFAWLVMHMKRGGSAFGGNYLASNEVPYGFMPFGPFHIGEPNPWQKWGGGSVMQQRDREGRALFNHRSINKFTLSPDAGGRYRDASESWKVYGPEQEQFYLQHLTKLRSLLRASSPPNGESPSGQSSAPSLASSSLEIVWIPQAL
jgi:hypothetical protein